VKTLVPFLPCRRNNSIIPFAGGAQRAPTRKLAIGGTTFSVVLGHGFCLAGLGFLMRLGILRSFEKEKGARKRAFGGVLDAL
jgi:hypothetical protein